ncbi:integrin alpha [Nonomuraea sp. NPDC002799]
MTRERPRFTRLRTAVLLAVTACGTPPPSSSSPARPAAGDCGRASARDFDGDGRDDIAIGYVGAVGRVHVLSADQVITIPTPPGNRTKGFGWSVTMAKANDDACIDVIVGAPGHTVAGKTGAGAVYILYGGGVAPPYRKLVSLRPQKDAGFGESITAYGDLIAIGAPNERPGGAVYLATKGSVTRAGSRRRPAACPARRNATTPSAHIWPSAPSHAAAWASWSAPPTTTRTDPAVNTVTTSRSARSPSCAA